MSDIFISYAREDRLRVEALAAALAVQGWSVWWDRDLPFGGRPFGQVIEEALAAARCVLVAWSPASVHSPWVLDEAAYARDRGKLFPVQLERVEPPLGFRQFHMADLVGWDGDEAHPEYLVCVAGLRAVLSASPSPAMGTGDEVPEPARLGPPRTWQGWLARQLASARLEHVVKLSLKLYLFFVLVGGLLGLLIATPSFFLNATLVDPMQHIAANAGAITVITIVTRLALLPFIAKRYADTRPAEIVLVMLGFILIDVWIAGVQSFLTPSTYETMIGQRQLAYWAQSLLPDLALFGGWLGLWQLRQGRDAAAS